MKNSQALNLRHSYSSWGGEKAYYQVRIVTEVWKSVCSVVDEVYLKMGIQEGGGVGEGLIEGAVFWVGSSLIDFFL